MPEPEKPYDEGGEETDKGKFDYGPEREGNVVKLLGEMTLEHLKLLGFGVGSVSHALCT